MKENMLLSGYIQADETPITCLDRTHPKGSRKGYYWVYRGMNGEVIYNWCTSREHKHLRKWLGNHFQGILQSDAYASLVKSHALDGKQTKRAGCLAHIPAKVRKRPRSAPADGQMVPENHRKTLPPRTNPPRSSNRRRNQSAHATTSQSSTDRPPQESDRPSPDKRKHLAQKSTWASTALCPRAMGKHASLTWSMAK